MNSSSARNIMLIGAGRVGANLLRHLQHRGFIIPAVVEPEIERHASIRALLPDARVLSSLPAALPQDIDICIIAVPDDNIRPIAEQLAAGIDDPPHTLFLHVSGLANAEHLEALTAAGATAGSMHPIQSFPDTALSPEELYGIGCGIDGSDTFWERARAFAEDLGWQPLRVNSERKALYHAACVFAGNFPVLLLDLAERLLEHAALEGDAVGEPERDHLLPMMETVIDRMRSMSVEHALTGPAARGDLAAIAAHLAEISEHVPEALRSYAALTMVGAAFAGESREDLVTLVDTWRPTAS